MITENQARAFAEDWVEAWNSHDLDAIVSHYEDDVILVSPIAVKILNHSSGAVIGKAALRQYFKQGIEVYPDLKFELIYVMWGISSMVLYYINQNGTKAGEFMEINAGGKVTEANHDIYNCTTIYNNF